VKTIRRIYIYLVCLIGLQSITAVTNNLLGGVIRWATNTDTPDALFFTSQIAVIIVGGPIFIGHWLWARHLARKDPDELNAPIRCLYLYITKGVFAIYVAVAVFSCANALLSIIFPTTNGYTLSRAELGGVIINSVMTVAFTGTLWLYHNYLTAKSKLPPNQFRHFVQHLYLLSFCGVGLLATAVGFTLFQIWIFAHIEGHQPFPLPFTIAMAVAGLMLWIYHEWARARDTKDQTADVLRWFYATLFSAAGVIMFLVGSFGTQTWLFHKIAGDEVARIPNTLAILITGIPILIYHEVALRLATRDSVQTLRWVYSLLFSGLGTLGTTVGLLTLLPWLFSGAATPNIPDTVALFLPCMVIWGYHRWVMGRTGKILGLAKDSVSKDSTRLLRRLYIFAFSGCGISLTVLGLTALQECIFAQFGEENVFQASNALAWLIVGAILWLYHWLWASRLFNSDVLAEKKSNLRKAYLYLIIYIATNTFIVTIALRINSTLRAILDLPAGGGLGLSVSIVIAAAALWAYHAFVLRSDIAKAGTSSLQARMQRLYWYLVAALGLGALIIGLSGDLSVTIRWAALRFKDDIALKEQFAGFSAALLAGFPVWLTAWIPAQSAATRSGPTGVSSRRSVLRKVYLYSFALIAFIITLVSAIAAVYQLLNTLFGLFGGDNVFADIAQSIGFTVIATAVWIYHGWVLRGDGRRAKKEEKIKEQRQTEEQESAIAELTATWSDFGIAIVDDGDGLLGCAVRNALQENLPYLPLIPIALTPQAADAMDTRQEKDLTKQITDAQVIVAPWTAIATSDAISDSSARKIIIPVQTPDVYWAGILLEKETGKRIVQIMEHILEATPKRSEPAQTPNEAKPEPVSEESSAGSEQ
jgi:hypothetical protein